MQLPPEVRLHIANLGYYANSRPEYEWAAQSSDPNRNGIYGLTWNTLKAIIAQVCPKAAKWTEFMNMGGNATVLDDITECLQNQEEELQANKHEYLLRILDLQLSPRIQQWYDQDVINNDTFKQLMEESS